MIEIVNKFEKMIYAVLMILLMVVLVASVGFLLIDLYDALYVHTPFLLQADEMVRIMGGFLLVLIGVELLDTIKAYFVENTIHVEIVVLLAIIAVARKVIILEPSLSNGFEFGFEMMGIGVIIVGLGTGYYLIKKAGLLSFPARQKPE